MGIKVYHGTREKFEHFDDSKMRGVNYGRAFYFTEDRDEASNFIMSDDGGFVLAVTLKVSNAFDVHSKSDAKLLAASLGLDWRKVATNYNHMLEGSGLDESDRENHYHKIINELFDLGVGSSYQSIKHELCQTIMDLGYDGIFDSKKRWWAVFSASQIVVDSRKKIPL